MEESKLKSVELFAGLSRAQLRRLSRVTDQLEVPAGTSLIDEGAFAHEFLLIVSGRASVHRDREVIGELGPGDFAGEIGAMRDARRNATVVADSELTVIVMTARDLRQVAREWPSVGERIDAAITARSPAPSEEHPLT